MKRRYRFTLFFVGLCMLLTYAGYYLIQDANTRTIDTLASKGFVDMGIIDAQEVIVKLNGEWKYYDGRRLERITQDDAYTLVSVPENIHTTKNKQFDRYGTYQLEVGGLKANTAYGIYSGSQVTAFNLYANQRLVFSNGVVSEDPKTHVSEWKPKAGTIYSDAKGQITLAVEISNYAYRDGLFWSSIQLGKPDLIFNNYYNKRLVDVAFLLGFLVIFFVLVSFYFIIKYDTSVIYLAMLLVIMFTRLLVTSSRPIMYLGQGISWDVLVRLEYMSGYLILPIFIMVVLSRTPYIKKRWISKTVVVLCMFIVFFVGISNHDIYSRFLTVYLWLAFLSVVGLLVISFRHHWHNRFVRNMFFMILLNFLTALTLELLGEPISYVPVAIFNGVVGVTGIVLNSFIGKIKENELLAMSAMIDPLTGLYNRLYFDELSKETFEDLDVHDLYILFLDLDGFKRINDTYGHDEGDYILQRISQRLRQSVRSDDIIIRYGGDEFILFLNLHKEEDIRKAAKRLLHQVTIVEQTSTKQYRLSASIGIARYDFNSGYTLEEYVRLSDQAMYKVKEQGGGSYAIV